VTALARGWFLARRTALEHAGLAVVLVFAGLVALGGFEGAWLVRGSAPHLMALALYAVALARALGQAVSDRSTSAAAMIAREVELVMLLIVGVYVLLQGTGGPRSFLYPLVYALVAFTMVLHRSRWTALAAVATTAALELAVARSVPGGWMVAGYHLTFVGFFALGHMLILSSLVRRLRHEHGRRVEAELARMRQEARDFRLIASQLPLDSRARSREDEELRMAQGAVESIHEQLFHHIDLLRHALALHTCAIVWVTGEAPAERDGRKDTRATPPLALKEVASASELLVERPELAGPGVLAAVLANPRPLRLKALGGRRLPPYYQGPEPVTDLCVVPLLDRGRVRGLLCADRIDDRPFSDADEANLTKASEHILRIVEHERVFTAVERGKYEQEQFYRASELLNQALTVDDVYEKAFAALRAIAPYDLAVVASWDDRSGKHGVLAVDVGASEATKPEWDELAARLEGLEFADTSGLVAMAVKNRHFMPATGELADPDMVVFTPRTRAKRAKSLVVLPLVRGEQVLGTITLASARSGLFPGPTREMLRVISHQVGVSLQNARMYASMEERATTDGLTGLTNHRAFQERCAQLQALAERTGQRFSLILTDIDHFKSVNDTYGHPVGDEVLRRVAALFRGRARKVDIVARYGGEEFVMVLPDTDAAGAEVFANKLREEVAAQTIASDNGNFGVTISMGIAEFPNDGDSRQQLIERADQALYWCKGHGRNRVKRWGPDV
jgi:diguanylate cyclase (GGDEF)-like protein